MRTASKYLISAYPGRPSRSTRRRDQIRVERLERDRLAAPRRVAGRGDRARDLRPLELVAEDRRRLPGRRLPEKQREQASAATGSASAARIAARKRSSAAAVAHSARGAEDDARVEVDLAPDEPARRRRRRRTPRRSRRGARAARPGSSRGRCRAACRASSRGDLVRAAEHGHAVDPPAAEARVVVDEPEDALAGRLAQLAHAGCGRCGPRRRSACVARCGRAACARRATSARSASRDAPIADRAEQRVDDEERRARSRRADASSDMYAERDDLRDDDRDGDRDQVARAGVAPDER